MARPRTFDEGEVLEKAVELFREKGFESTSMPELTTRLGICRQSLYNAFGDKRALYLAALERYGKREVGSKLAVLAGDGPPLDNVRTIVRGWAALASQCPTDGCLTAGAILEQRDDLEALAIVEAQVDRLEAGLLDALSRAQSDGTLRPEAQPPRLARTLTTTAYGIALLSRLPNAGPRIADAVSAMLSMLDDASTEM